jgi:arginyl-tRNA synthetase
LVFKTLITKIVKMSITDTLKEQVAAAVKELYGADFEAKQINVSPTRKEVEGDYTVLVFPFAKVARKKPEAIGEEIGNYLKANMSQIAGFNTIAGFLNLVVSDNMWASMLEDFMLQGQFGIAPKNGEKVMVEYSSPNTNKPLHLGHIRNNLLGWSMAKILEAAGYDVVKVQVINDRGVHICKSMWAWEQFGNGETPQSTGIKGDHLIGKYYVLFNRKLEEEYTDWKTSAEAEAKFLEWLNSEGGQKATEENGDSNVKPYFFKSVYKNKYFNDNSPIGKEIKEMLLKWEAKDPHVYQLWEMMNGWVYAGFNETYKNLGVSFDKNYYESQTYLLGKDTIEKGLEQGIFYKIDDGSTWIDLTDAKLDKKIVLRSDGTSVYMTQDLGTAQKRYEDYGVSKMIYVVGDEQDYHFNVLFEILKRLGEPYADGLYHLSYGMVELPTGKMKSREGKVVDADDLMVEVQEVAKKVAEESGGLAGMDETLVHKIHQQIGLGALKYFMLKVNPKKGMVFNPEESVDFQGQTGPFVQYACMRTKALARKAGAYDKALAATYTDVTTQEQELLLAVQGFPQAIQKAAAAYRPSEIANYIYNLAKLFNRFYKECPILKSDTPPNAQSFRMNLSQITGQVLETGLDLLGIEAPEFM